MSSGNELEKPTNHWGNYLGSDLRDYFLRNFDKADCSFFISDPTGNEDSQRELRSFKWMLCDFSPVLKRILNGEKYQAKNFKMIPVSDENFEVLLSFVHTRTVLDGSFSYLLDLYETAMKYESGLLIYAIMRKLELDDPIGNWIRFAALAWRDRDTNPRLKYVFEQSQNKVKEWKKTFERDLTTNLETCSHFDFKLFHALLCALKELNVNPLIRLKTVEAYVLKNISKGKTLEEMKDQNNCTSDIVHLFLSYVQFDKMSVKDFDNGPAKSALIGEELKKRYGSVDREMSNLSKCIIVCSFVGLTYILCRR